MMIFETSRPLVRGCPQVEAHTDVSRCGSLQSGWRWKQRGAPHVITPAPQFPSHCSGISHWGVKMGWTPSSTANSVKIRCSNMRPRAVLVTSTVCLSYIHDEKQGPGSVQPSPAQPSPVWPSPALFSDAEPTHHHPSYLPEL